MSLLPLLHAVSNMTLCKVMVVQGTERFNGSCISQVVSDDLVELWKVPAIPLPQAHDIVVELLI